MGRNNWNKMNPTFLFLELTKKCPLHCVHCDMWMQQDSINRMDLQRYFEIVREFSAIGGKTVVICGGETWIHPQFFAVCSFARSLNLNVFSVTSGITINESNIKKVITEGPTEVTVSIDHPYAGGHDYMRGVIGTFNKATRAISLINENGGTVVAMGLITKKTIKLLDEFYELAFKLNVRLKLNFLQPTFERHYADCYFKNNVVQNWDEVEKQLNNIKNKYNIIFNPKWEVALKAFINGNYKQLEAGWRIPEYTTDVICNSFERNIMVTQTGMARSCFSAAFPGTQLYQYGDLKKFWNNKEKQPMCTRPCGISHSVRAEKCYDLYQISKKH